MRKFLDFSKRTAPHPNNQSIQNKNVPDKILGTFLFLDTSSLLSLKISRNPRSDEHKTRESCRY